MKSKIKNMDKFLFLLLVIYTILGLVMIFSASSVTAVLQYGKTESYFFVKQLFYVILAYAVGIFILFVPIGLINKFRKLNRILALFAVVLLFLTYVGGETLNGATSWLRIGNFIIQPSEFVKTLLIMYIAFSFTNTRKMFKNYKFLMPFAVAVVCVFLIAIQPDFGTAMILAFTCFLIFISLPLKDTNYKKLKVIAGSGLIVIIFLFLMGNGILKNVLNEEQISRLNYKNPCTRYSEKTGYQVCNGYIAINNGGLFGLGLGNSKQKYLYLPEAYTDFIFPIIVEELGSVGATIIILGFLIMLYKILSIARQSETLTGSLLAYGTFALILSHLLINLLGVTAIIPLTGVPLPFLSNGGSFAFNLIILMFIVLRVSIENKNIKLRKEINRM